MDNVDKVTRSKVMSSIRSFGNRSTEIAMVRLLKECQLAGWRRHWPVRGRPDFVWPQARIAVFVDGCYWHCCPKHGKTPESNHEYWERKFRRNQARDKEVNRALRAKGWKVLRIWEHDIQAASKNIVRRIRWAMTRAEIT